MDRSHGKVTVLLRSECWTISLNVSPRMLWVLQKSSLKRSRLRTSSSVKKPVSPLSLVLLKPEGFFAPGAVIAFSLLRLGSFVEDLRAGSILDCCWIGVSGSGLFFERSLVALFARSGELSAEASCVSDVGFSRFAASCEVSATLLRFCRCFSEELARSSWLDIFLFRLDDAFFCVF